MQQALKNIRVSLKSILFILFIICSFTNGLKAQLVVKDYYFDFQAKPLVQRYFANSGIKIDTVEWFGNTRFSIGSFTGGNLAKLGMQEGIVLSTGLVADIPGIANDTLNEDLEFNGNNLLESLIPANDTTYDAIVLRITFTPLSDSVWFRYILASEEFPPFHDTTKDVFGFFLSGPNPSGGNYVNKHMAVFPGTNLDIKIDSFAHAPYNQYYLHNDTTAIKFNGLTKLMTAGCKVKHCNQYVLEIIIGDVRDGHYDSGLFLQGGGLTSTKYTVAVKGTNGDNGMVEKCGTATFIFNRDSITSTPELRNFDITGTATNLNDYTDTLGNPMPSQVTFPPFRKQVEIKVKAVDDGITEPLENVIVTLPGVSMCPEFPVRGILNIKNTDPLTVSAIGDTIVCNENNEKPFLTALVNGGVGPFKYEWFYDGNVSGDTIESGVMTLPEYNSANEKPYYLYHVAITDSCLSEAVSNDVMVTIKCPIKTTNVITPNSDGYNDKFVVKHIGEYPNSKLVVMNRWGRKVYESNNYHNDWDGDKLADGVYFFIIELTDGSKYQGSVTILR